MASASKKPPINPVGLGSSFSSVARQVLQNNNYGGIENLSGSKAEGMLSYNLSAANAINNSVMKRRTL